MVSEEISEPQNRLMRMKHKKRPASEAHKPAPARSVQRDVRFWSNAISLRYFGSPVYLVGGALKDDVDPRDIDLVVVVEDQIFWQMYCAPEYDLETFLGAWNAGGFEHPPSRGWSRWARDCVKQGRWLMERLERCVDFKVQPVSYAKTHHKGKPKLLISSDFMNR